MNNSMEIDLDTSGHVLGKSLLNLVSQYDDNFGVARAKHCYREVMANIDDPKWSSQSFVECVPKLEEATSKSGIDAHSIFLSCLITDLLIMETVPVNLVRELIIYYEWPTSPSKLVKNLGDTDPMVRALLFHIFLKKNLVQENIVDNEEFVDEKYKKKVGKRSFITILLCVLVLASWLTYKYFKLTF